MNSATSPLSPDALLTEVDNRLVQALENFFQRSRPAIEDGILRALSRDMSPSMLATSEDCTGWLHLHPDQLSEAFAGQYRTHLAQSRTRLPHSHSSDAPDGGLQLLDDEALARQLSISKSSQRLADALFPELQPFLARVSSLLDVLPADLTSRYSPIPVVTALSEALDAVGLSIQSGTLLLQQAMLPLQDTLRQAYTALNQYLERQGVVTRNAPLPRRATRQGGFSTAGSDVLAYIQGTTGSGTAFTLPADHARGHTSGGTPTVAGLAEHPGAGLPIANAPAGGAAPSVRPSFRESLDQWQSAAPADHLAPDGTPVLLLRQIHHHAHDTDAGQVDLAMLDAMASLFEFILQDPDVSASYKSAIAQLQLPALRVALASPEFFSDERHPARQTLDLLGIFSRRFPEAHTEYPAAYAEVESACLSIVHQPARQTEAFAEAHDKLTEWMSAENVRADAAMAADVARLESIERQELGMLLALENLQELTARHPAPASVLHQLERAWVPYMAALYVEELGEGPAWRAAGSTLLNLFLSLQAPIDAATRETRLQTLPALNRDLRNGLLSQQAEPEQLREFFAAITAAQECWIRPELSHPEAPVSHFEASYASAPGQLVQALHTGHPSSPDSVGEQIDNLQEGDWVDFHPDYEGLETARVAWVGVQGYLLFSDSEGDTRFSLDSTQLAAAIRAGQASIPEQSLTRKAMLRLRDQLQSKAS